jgi:hypothetical protein
MDNVYTLRTQRSKFLSNEQLLDLILIVTTKLSVHHKELVTRALRYKFYTLDNNEYWKKFKLKDNGLMFEALKNPVTELAEIKKDLISQAELLFSK